MQLVLHAPFGARLNWAWGLALRKRFCRSFNFELQAAATDNGIVISLAEQHSFPLEVIFRFLTPDSVEDVLTQAMLPAPMFAARWEWNASRALAVMRFAGGRKVAPRDRAYLCRGFCAVLVPLAARGRRHTASRRERSPPGDQAAPRVRNLVRGLGERDLCPPDCEIRPRDARPALSVWRCDVGTDFPAPGIRDGSGCSARRAKRRPIVTFRRAVRRVRPTGSHRSPFCFEKTRNGSSPRNGRAIQSRPYPIRLGRFLAS